MQHEDDIDQALLTTQIISQGIILVLLILWGIAVISLY